jgi:hypothetical protein
MLRASRRAPGPSHGDLFRAGLRHGRGQDSDRVPTGQFIGGISYITENAAPANIVSLEPTRHVSWPKEKLNNFMKKNSYLHTALQ